MRVLLDTCVLSELRDRNSHLAVRQAVRKLDDQSLFVSVVSIGEIWKGIALLESSPKRRALETWVETLERAFADRILPVDLKSCRIWGEITAAAQKAGRTVHAADGLIAATALRHGLQVMTRNATDFAPTGVSVLNPWSA